MFEAQHPGRSASIGVLTRPVVSVALEAQLVAVFGDMNRIGLEIPLTAGFAGEFGAAHELPQLPVHRNDVLGAGRTQKLAQFVAPGMAAAVDGAPRVKLAVVTPVDVGPLSEEPVDEPRHRLLVARNGLAAQDDAIARVEFEVGMLSLREAHEHAAPLALAPTAQDELPFGGHARQVRGIA